MATRTDINVGWYIGSDFVLRIPVIGESPDGGITPGPPLSMTGWSLGFVIRARRADGAGRRLLLRTSAMGEGITTESSGAPAITDDVAVIAIPADVYEEAAEEDVTYSYALWRLDATARQPLKYGTLRMEAVASL